MNHLQLIENQARALKSYKFQSSFRQVQINLITHVYKLGGPIFEPVSMNSATLSDNGLTYSFGSYFDRRTMKYDVLLELGFININSENHIQADFDYSITHDNFIASATHSNSAKIPPAEMMLLAKLGKVKTETHSSSYTSTSIFCETHISDDIPF